MDEIMTIKELSQYLKMNERTISKLATQGLIPATKIANQWRFMRSVVNQWLEQQMIGMPPEQLEILESELISSPLRVTTFLTPELIVPNAESHQKVGLLKEMINLGTQRKLIKKPAIVLKTLVKREALCSTAVGDEVAIPHPRQPLGEAYAKPLVMMARSAEGIDFNALDNKPTKLIFLIILPDDYTHLKILARLSRMIRDGNFRENLKSAPGSLEIYELIRAKDIELGSLNAN